MVQSRVHPEDVTNLLEELEEYIVQPDKHKETPDIVEELTENHSNGEESMASQPTQISNWMTPNIVEELTENVELFTSYSFECPFCSQIYKTASELQGHIRDNHDNGEEIMASQPTEVSNWEQLTYTCKQCGGEFENEGDLAYHIKIIHEYGESRQPYLC